ncbi:polysialyltransferase family glycosyltransferase [Calidifontibacter terrae]
MRVLITGVRSRTHLIHLAAFLRKALTEESQIDVDYVGGGRFLGNAAVSEQDVRDAFPDDPRLTVVMRDAVPADVPADLTYLSVGAPGLKPWLRLKRAQPRGSVRVVVTDEGLGTYGGLATRRAAWRRQGVREPWRTARAVAVEAGSRTLTGQRWAMYDKAREWALNEQIADEFRRGVSVGPRSNEVVMLTQPWVQLGLLTAGAYRAHLDEVADVVAAQGNTLVVRPHPAEPPGAYAGMTVIEGGLLAERDARVVNAAGVVGGTSTALLNLRTLYGVPASRLTVAGLEHLDTELGADQRALLATYLPPVTDVGRWSGLGS